MQPLRPQQDYLRFLSEGRFMIQRCRDSGKYVFYPRVAAPGSGSTDLEWVEACGAGTVYATTVVRSREQPEGYNVALVDLAEGVRMMSKVEGLAAADVRIGMAVTASVIVRDGEGCVVFRPAQPA